MGEKHKSFSAHTAVLTFGLLLWAMEAPASPAQPSCASVVFEATKFTVCRFDSHADELRLVLTDSNGVVLRGFQHLANELGPNKARVLFAMNAGMFETDGTPVGLLIRNGVQDHALNKNSGQGNFYLQPNGVFSIEADGSVHIQTTQVFQARQTRPTWATQSGPMLLTNGAVNPAFDANGTSQFVRNGVGLVNDHEAVFAISEEPVSFGRFARLFLSGLRCREALYFDGAISSLWEPATGRMDRDHPLGPMIVLLKK
jgi:uncharacterized protein YigE (DUF2233 family)